MGHGNDDKSKESSVMGHSRHTHASHGSDKGHEHGHGHAHEERPV